MVKASVVPFQMMVAVVVAVCVLFLLGTPASAAPRLAVAIGIGTSGITVPDGIESGLTTVTMSNSDRAPHILSIAHLKEGETPESIGAAAAENPNAVFALLDTVYSPGFQLPGGSATFVATLQPGIWMATDVLAPGAPTFFTVTEGDGDGTAQPSEAASVGMMDFSFTGLPTMLNAGKNTIRLTNNGRQNHEMVVYKLNEGQTAEQFVAAAAESEGNVPNEVAGGMAAGPGSDLWTDYTFTPGNYIAVCNIPDPASGMPHVALGMMAAFSVADSAAPTTMPTTGMSTTLAQTLMGWGAICLGIGFTIRAAYLRTR